MGPDDTAPIISRLTATGAKDRSEIAADEVPAAAPVVLGEAEMLAMFDDV
jgi:hypothetical protein